MENCRNFTRSDLENGYVVCEDVHLPSGSVSMIHFSTNGVYVLSRGKRSPEQRYREVKEILQAPRLRFYVLDNGDGVTGLYDPQTQSLSVPLTEDELTEDICQWLNSGRMIYHNTSVERMITRLKRADIKARGYAASEDGKLYILRHGTLHPASPASSELQFYLTLFGGTLGLHRFALGKFWSGLAYLLTGGFFLAGWLTDLLQLFIGMQKDRRKLYLFPLSNRKTKLLILPVGMFVTAFLFLCYMAVTAQLGFGFLNFFAEKIGSTDPETWQSLKDTLIDLSGR